MADKRLSKATRPQLATLLRRALVVMASTILTEDRFLTVRQQRERKRLLRSVDRWDIR